MNKTKKSVESLIGAVPKFVHDDHRAMDLMFTISSFIKEGEDIKSEWVDELYGLLIQRIRIMKKEDE